MIKGRVSLTLEERANLLDASKWVADFDWHQVQELAQFLEAFEVPPGTELAEEGSAEASTAIIAKGRVKIVKEDSSGTRKEICRLGPGKTFGEMSLIDGYPRSAAVIAAEPVTILELDEKNFLRLMHDRPQLAAPLLLKICRLLSARLRQTSGRLIDYLQE
jgi:CRP-like cAMP-binding protein